MDIIKVLFRISWSDFIQKWHKFEKFYRSEVFQFDLRQAPVRSQESLDEITYLINNTLLA